MNAEDASQIEIAKAIAVIVHWGQVDKSGAPYITHPERVAARLDKPRNSEIAAAWLHDVLEDSDLTSENLRAAGIDWTTIATVEKLTRTPDQSPEDYYENIRESYSARRIKLADIADNTDPNRLALLDDATIARLVRKYAKARMLLGVTP